jgi:hypothetical protein
MVLQRPQRAAAARHYATTIDPAGWWVVQLHGRIRYKSVSDLKGASMPVKRLDDPKLKQDVLCGNYGVNLSCAGTPVAATYDSGIFRTTPDERHQPRLHCSSSA